MLKGIHLKLLFGLATPKAAPKVVMDALTGVRVATTSDKRSGFQLSFALGKRSPLLKEYLARGFFDPPQRVIIAVIFKGRTHVLMDGVIANHETSPSNEPGQSTFTATGEDLTRMMDIVDLSGIPFPATPISGRVAIILGKYTMIGVRPKVIPSVLVNIPNPLEEIPVQVGTDFKYISSLANTVGHVFYLEPGPKLGSSIAYWGPEIKVGVPQEALIVNSDAHNNAEVSTISFDGFAKTLFLVLIQERTTKIPIPIPVPDITPLNPPLGRKPIPPLRIEPIRGLAKSSPLHAATVALAEAARSADVISGSGNVDVLRYGRLLKARQLVSIRGAGPTLNGLYYVKGVTHDITPGSYKQSFSLSRNAFVPF